MYTFTFFDKLGKPVYSEDNNGDFHNVSLTVTDKRIKKLSTLRHKAFKHAHQAKYCALDIAGCIIQEGAMQRKTIETYYFYPNALGWMPKVKSWLY